MVKNPNSRPCYVEEFDGEALHELAEMAKRYVKYNEYKIAPRFNKAKDIQEYLRSIPDGKYSDFSVSVWEIMTALVRYGIQLEKDHNQNAKE